MAGSIARTLSIASFVLIAAVVIAALRPAVAQSPNPFLVADVEVDQTAATVAQAREAALTEGQRKAFRRLLERLVPSDQQAKLPRPSAAQIADLVENFEVQSERGSAVRYIATLTFRFNADGVRNLLRRAGLPFAETYARPMVVLPIYHNDAVSVLWDDPNPWLAAWRALPPTDGLQPLAIPLGDLADIGAINADQARGGDPERIETVAKRYGAGGVIVVEANLDRSREGQTDLQVTTTRFDIGVPEQTVVDTYVANPNEGLEALLARAAAASARAIDERWKSELVLQFGQEATLVGDVVFGTLPEWIAVRDRLAETAIVRKTDILSLSRGRARIELHYIGSEAALRLALAQKDLLLSQDAGLWEVSLRQAGEGNKTTRP